MKSDSKKFPVLNNILITCSVLGSATLFCFALEGLTLPESRTHVPLIYVFAVLLISRFTNGYLYGVFAAIASVVCVNYIFTYPYFEFDFTIAGSAAGIIENKDYLSKEQEMELLGNIQEDAQWLVRIVENLLSITRMNADDARLETQEELAEDVISGAILKFQQETVKKIKSRRLIKEQMTTLQNHSEPQN